MSYHYDWLVRQIEAMVVMIRYVLKGERIPWVTLEEAAAVPAGENMLYLQLSALVRQGRICQAEDLLYEALEDPTRQVLEAGVRFYEELARLPDEVLRQADFSRQEILEGLQHLCQSFGIPM